MGPCGRRTRPLGERSVHRLFWMRMISFEGTLAWGLLCQIEENAGGWCVAEKRRK